MVTITVLDTCVALISGLIIFPARFAFGVKPSNGRNLIFITLPNIFNSMPMKGSGVPFFSYACFCVCIYHYYRFRERYCICHGSDRMFQKASRNL